MLELDSVEETANADAQVTRVYGASSVNLLPARDIETARRHLRPNIRAPRSRPAFDLPDAFYFIGGPIFLLLFLRVLVIFLNGFEEKRREEQRAATATVKNVADQAVDQMPVEKVPSE